MKESENQTLHREFSLLCIKFRKACALPDSGRKRSLIVELSAKLDAYRPHVSKRAWARVSKEH